MELCRSWDRSCAWRKSIWGASEIRPPKPWGLAQMPYAERLCALQMYFTEEERRKLYTSDFAKSATMEGTTASRFARLLTGMTTQRSR